MNDDKLPQDARIETAAAQALGAVDDQTRGVVPPVHLATTFIRDADNAYSSGFSYARPDNATARQAEAVLCRLEDGAAAALFASGMAAAVTLFQALKAGDHVIAPQVMYWALRNWLSNDLSSLGVDVSFVDTTRTETVASEIRPGRTKIVWVETPANPIWHISDIAALAEVAHAAGAVLAVDSTCATPVLTQPLKLGADIVMHSATKYLNGHSDALAGVLVAREEDALWQEILRRRAAQGAIIGPFEAFLLLRGMRTLVLRVNMACDNAMALAEHFAGDRRIEAVLHPGLTTHPAHELAKRQMSGRFGGMLSLCVRGGEQAAIATAAQVRVWKRATSLGGVESLIEHRASVEGAQSPAPASMLRLSAGIEHIDDLISDLDQALRRAGVSA